MTHYKRKIRRSIDRQLINKACQFVLGNTKSCLKVFLFKMNKISINKYTEKDFKHWVD